MEMFYNSEYFALVTYADRGLEVIDKTRRLSGLVVGDAEQNILLTIEEYVAKNKPTHDEMDEWIMARFSGICLHPVCLH